MKVVLTHKYIEKALIFLFDFLMFFCFLFEFRLGIGVTTRRVVLMIAVLYVLKHIGRFKKKICILPQKAILLSICTILLVALIVLINRVNYRTVSKNTNMNMRYILYIVFYVYFFAMYCICRFDSAVSLCKTYIAVIRFQSFAVFGAALNTDFRVFLFKNTLADQYAEDMLEAVLAGSRICGIQLMASAGSLTLCTGCILLLYLIINNYISNRYFLLNFGMIAAATMLIGRTGFYMEILLFPVYLIGYKSHRKYVSLAAAALLMIMVLSCAAGRLDRWVIAYYKRWIGEIFYSDRLRQTLQWIGASKVPAFSKEMLLGTNVLKGILPTGFIMGADSGYARMYCAIGLIGCILYYGSFFIVYMAMACKIKNRKNRIYYLVCVLFTFIIEYKEPFFMKYFFPFIILVIGMFMVLQERKKYENLLFDRSAF